MKTTRQRDLAKIHVAKKQLQIDDEQYRDILWTLARVRSAADLDTHGRAQLLAYLRKLGFRAKRGTSHHEGRPHNTDSDDQLKKIEALLADQRLPWSYVNGIMQQMKIQQPRIEFLSAQQKTAIIAALTRRQKRQATSAPEQDDSHA